MALRLQTFIPISGLTRHEVKSRLCRSSWRAFASTHPFMLASTSTRRLSLLALPFLHGICFPSPWSPSFPPHALALIPFLSRQGAALTHLDSLPPHDLVLWTDGSVPFPFGKGGSGVLINCSLCGTEASLSFSAGSVCSSFSAEACAILYALCWSRQHQQVRYFSSLLLLSDLRFAFATHSSPPSLLLSQTLWQICQELSSLFSCTIRLQWIPGHSFFPGNDAADELARRGVLLAPSAVPCSLSLLISRIHLYLHSWTGGVLSHRNFSTHRFPQFPPRNLCSPVMLAVSSLVFTATDTAFC